MARVMTIIWGAFMAATVFYVLVAWIMFGGKGTVLPDAEAGPQVPIAPILGVVAFLVVTASIAVERWWFSGARIVARLQGPPVYEVLIAGPQSGGPTREVFERLDEPDRKLACLVPFYQTGMIVIWAMRESVAVLGLAAAIVLADFMVVVPFGVGALAFLAIKMPRPAAFLAQVRALPGAIT